jgi:hypothetical protein
MTKRNVFLKRNKRNAKLRNKRTAKLKNKKNEKIRNTKTKKNTKKHKKQYFNTKKNKYSNKKNTLNYQKGGSDCRMGLMTEIGFNVPENNGIKGLTVPNGKALITNKPECITSNIHP